MDISSNQLKKKCLEVFSRCAPPLIFDRYFKIISKNELKNIVNENSVSGMPYIQELFDCNRFSLTLRAEISKWQVKKYTENKDKDWKYPICIGSCLIEDHPIHQLCLAFCQEGFFYVEPQTNQLMKIKDTSKVLFMEF